MSKIQVGANEAHEKLTARLYIQPLNESGFIDAGNVQSYNNTEAREYRTRLAADDGFRRVNDEQVDTVHQMLEFVLDERDEYNERLISLAKSVVNADQEAAADESETFLDVGLGRAYFLAKRPVTEGSVVVTVDVSTKTEGTDYLIDLNTGKLTILEGGTILEGDDVNVEYDVPARGFQQWTALEQALFRGQARVEEFNQLSKEPLRVMTGFAHISITAFPEQSGEFGTYTARLTFTERPIITKRFEASGLTPDAGS